MFESVETLDVRPRKTLSPVVSIASAPPGIGVRRVRLHGDANPGNSENKKSHGSIRSAIAEARPRSLVLAGGVAANRLLRERFTALAEECGLALAIPALKYCGDNAAMIAVAGRPALLRGESHLDVLDADASAVLGGAEAQRVSRRHL